MSPVSATYWGIPGFAIFWGLFFIAAGLFLQRAYVLYRLVRLGKAENRFDRIGERFKAMLVEVVPQWCNLKTVTRQDLAGIAHALFFWSFLLFFASYVIFIGLGAGFGLSSLIKGSVFETVYLSVLDVAAVVVIVSLAVAAVRRYVIRPARLEPSAEAAMILGIVGSLMVLHLIGGAFEYAARGGTTTWPPLTGALADLLQKSGLSEGTLENGYRLFWWLHYFVLLGFTVYIPRSKHLHILASPVNSFFKQLGPGPKVVLEPIPLAEMEQEQPSFGISKLQDFTWKDMVDFYACAVCGRCHVNCPAQLSGKSLSPRDMIHDLKEHLLEVGPELLAAKPTASSNGHSEASAEPATETTVESPVKTLIGGVVSEDAIWACTTCGACQEICPVSNEHVRKIIGFRRNLVMTQNQMPETAQTMLRNMQSRGHPWAGIQSLRLRGDWTADLDLKILGVSAESADTLFWVGCTGALVERNVAATLSMTRVLKAAGVDFAVLGEAETCCGDPARRAGSECDFQMAAEQNIEVFKNYGVKQIITACPHCYNTLKNEYPRFGGAFTVTHYTQFIAELVGQGKLKLGNGVDSKLTYHDPCYLGRYNDVYSEPRGILQAIPKTNLVEMERSRKMALCCGGGGGHMWIEEQPGTTKINQLRLDDAVKTGADTVVTACPFCLQMFEESIEHRGIKDSLKTRDFVEVVEAAMQQA